MVVEVTGFLDLDSLRVSSSLAISWDDCCVLHPPCLNASPQVGREGYVGFCV